MARKRPRIPDPRPVLLIAGAEERLQVLLAEDGELLAAQELAVGGRAMQHMAPAVEDLLRRLSIGPDRLTGVAAVRGPGSFTGLRISLGLALGIALPAGLPMAGLDHLPLLAAGPAPLLTGSLAVVTHSRSRQVYLQGFSVPDLTPLGPPAPLGVEDAARAILAMPQPHHALGTGWRNNAAFFADALPGVAALDERFNTPMLHVLARATRTAEYAHTPPEPLYLRASDAEDNLGAIAAARGIDPDEARARLAEATSGLAAPHCTDE